MRCPRCSHLDDRVLDSRSARMGDTIRRRRMCLGCGHRFTTYEEVVRTKLRVVKRDGRHEELDRNKLAGGIVRACEKRPISTEQIENMVQGIVSDLENEYEREVPSKIIGMKVMDCLEKLDEVAYVRFASVYKRFKDATQFVKTVDELAGRE
ncbi:MAG: transcriptional regulator NrdR [bacterium]